MVAFLLDVIPAASLARSPAETSSVLLFAVMFGFALHRLGSKGQLIFNVIESFSQVIFGIINMIMRRRLSVPSVRWPSPSVSMASVRWSSWVS